MRRQMCSKTTNIDELANLFVKKCIVNDMKHVNIIHRYLYNLHNLPSITYNNTIINYKSISAFHGSTKDKNDIMNKTRESIIGAIANNKIPERYYDISRQWNKLRYAIINYIEELHKFKIEKITLIHKAGRKYNYDFQVNINNTSIYNLELKFNAESISDAPQFVSPSNPSQYMSGNYEEHYYDNYLPKLAEFGGLLLPDKKTYLKQINGNNPKCMITYKTLYKENEEFKNLANKLSKDSIETFIQKYELDIVSLSRYLQTSQKDKIYMLYKNGKFNKEIPDMNDYELVSYEKDKNRYIVTNQNNKKIYVLLRWKNCNGIAFPAFQIS